MTNDFIEPEFYESVPVEQILPPENEPEFENADIITTSVNTSSSKTIFESVSANRLEDRIARVLAEVEELQLDVNGDMSIGCQINLIQSKIFSLVTMNGNSTNGTTAKSTDNVDRINDGYKHMSRLKDLETRLSNLEKIVGLNNNVTSQHHSNLKSSGGFINALESVDFNLKLLNDPELLANNVMSNLNQEYSTLARLEPISHLIPHILTRLVSLQAIHSKSKDLQNNVEEIFHQNKALLEIAEGLKESHDVLCKSLESTKEITKSNMKLLGK
jgi:hypothetical protein